MFSQLVTEILELLGEAKAVAPQDDDVPDVVETRPDTAKAAVAKLTASCKKRLNADPDGATEAHKSRLENLRSRFSNACSNLGGSPSDDRLNHIKAEYAQLLSAFGEIKEEIAHRADLKKRLAELAPDGASGPALVPGAPAEDTKTLEKLRGEAATALSSATNAEELAAAEVRLAAVAKERMAVETLVEARGKRAEALRQEAAAVVAPPEAPPGTLDAERKAVTTPLAAPQLTELALTTAEGALKNLKLAWEAAEKEAAALRQMRAIFAKEADQLRKRIEEVVGKLSSKQNSQRGTAATILGNIAEGEKRLAVTATRTETEGFPPILAAAKEQFLAGVISGVVGVKNDAGNAAAAYLRDELERLHAEVTDLPKIDDKSNAYAETAKKQYSTANQKLGIGSANQASQARPFIEALGETIKEFRAYVGAAGIVLGQRKVAVAQKVAVGDPDGTSAAFAAALKGVRESVTKTLAKPLIEVNIAEAEAQAAPFAALWGKADADAKAFKRVTTAKVTLTSELNGVIAAARPAARIELEKLRVTAEARASLTGMDRDMPKTATLHEALVARMQQVKAEGSFADADKTPFADIDEGERELAFNLCGPALIGKMGADEKKALGAVLKSDGPAIQLLAESAFGGNPKVFAKVLGDCGPGGLATLARALDGNGNATARASLDGLIEKGGLGDDPAIMAQLLGAAPAATDSQEVKEAKEKRQAQNAAALKSLANNFTGAEGQAAMGTLLGDCGLGTSPGALASLLQEDGFKGDGAKVRGFADAFVGDTAERQADRAGFARIVTTGGVREHPKVLGPLARQAGAAGVKKIGAAFTQPADCANLKGLLDGGGMSGDTNTLATKHEHPDTLAKVFVDGLDGDGENLKTFAQAFSGVDGRAKSKEMLDAFNEFEDKHAAARQPGRGIAGLLDEHHLTGTTEQKIKKLSTQFVPQIRAVPEGNQRKQAIRFAPHFGKATAQEGWKPKSVAMGGAGIEKVTASVLKRHQPETFDRSKMKDDTPQSMFPPGTDVGAVLDQAMGLITADRTRAQQVPVTVGPPPTTITVEIGFLNGDTVNHFGPRGTPGTPHPQETPLFTNAEINAIYAASK